MKSRLPTRLFSVLALACSVLSPAVLHADDPAKPSFLLATEGRLAASDYTLDELAQMFSSFKHEPLDKAGFNAMVMPIHYEDPDGIGDPNEAYAFSFLLSDALDWAPGCYCMRHAYFTYERTPELMQPLASKYDTALVSRAVKSWDATHAIGGTLVKSKDGYSGTLEIFDPEGKQIDRESFDKPRSYFDLLGDMTAAAMKFFGEPANDALLQYLKTPRCKDPQSLALLGSVAYMPRENMLKVVDQILQKDPHFSEVRVWAAQQRYWMDGDDGRATREKVYALKGYLTEEGLRTLGQPSIFVLSSASLQKWWQQAATLCPEDSPLLVNQTLSLAQQIPDLSEHVIDLTAKACEKYPNSYYLMLSAAPIFETPQLGHFDGGVGAGMYIAALQSRFLTGTGSKDEAIDKLAEILDAHGRPDITAQLLTAEKGFSSPESAFNLLDAYSDLCQFEMVLKVYDTHPPIPPQEQGPMVVRVMHAAAMLGDADRIDDLIASQRQSLKQAQLMPLAQAIHDSLAGKPVDIAKLESEAKGQGSRTQVLQFACQLDLAAGQEKLRDALWNEFATEPDARTFFILLDAYDRHKPRPEMVDVYRTMQWLFPDDPWMVKAAADGLQRHANSPGPDIETCNAALRQYPPHPRSLGRAGETEAQMKYVRGQITPWKAVAAIRQLSDQGYFQAATDMAQRYTNYLAGTNYPGNAVWFSHLMHLVELQKDAAQKKQ
jgi:hypothetical protein